MRLMNINSLTTINDKEPQPITRVLQNGGVKSKLKLCAS